MKYLLPLFLFCLIFCACNGSKSNIKERSFTEQFAELEQSPLQTPDNSDIGLTAMQNEDDRYMDVTREAQKERRAQPPLVESEYIFKVKPDKSIYSYTEYNEVWVEEPSAQDYKTTKRLWAKPKRINPNGPQQPAAEQPAAQAAAASAPEPAPDISSYEAPEADTSSGDEGYTLEE